MVLFFFLPVAVGAHLLNQMNSVRAVGMLDTLFHNIGSKFMLGQSENFATNRADYKGLVLLQNKQTINQKVFPRKFPYKSKGKVKVHSTVHWSNYVLLMLTK